MLILVVELDVGGLGQVLKLAAQTRIPFDFPQVGKPGIRHSASVLQVDGRTPVTHCAEFVEALMKHSRQAGLLRQNRSSFTVQAVLWGIAEVVVEEVFDVVVKLLVVLGDKVEDEVLSELVVELLVVLGNKVDNGVLSELVETGQRV